LPRHARQRRARLVGGDGLLFHVLAPGAAPEVRGLLADHAAYLRALLDAHEIAEIRGFSNARSVWPPRRCSALPPRRGFYDRLPEDSALGRLALADRPIGDNGLMAMRCSGSMR